MMMEKPKMIELWKQFFNPSAPPCGICKQRPWAHSKETHAYRPLDKRIMEPSEC